MTRAAWIVACAALAASSSARAQTPLHPLTLAWARCDGADRCPPQSEVMSAVRARLGRDPFSLLASVSAEASVERAADRWRARLIVRDGSGATLMRRDLDDGSEDCATIAGAVVVSVTLALAPPPGGDPRPATDAERAPPVDLRVPEAPRVTPPPATPRVFGERPRVSLGAEALVGPLPDVTPGVTARLDAPLSQRFSFAGAVAFSPEHRKSDDPRWAFGMTRATVELCARARPWRWLELSACAGATLGAVHVVTFGPTPVAPGNYPWFALAFEARAAARLIGPLFVDVGATGAVALVANDFVIERAVPVSIFAQSSAALAGSVGLGVEL